MEGCSESRSSTQLQGILESEGQVCRLGNMDMRISGKREAANRTWVRSIGNRRRESEGQVRTQGKVGSLVRTELVFPSGLSSYFPEWPLCSKPTSSSQHPHTTSRILLLKTLLQVLCQTQAHVVKAGPCPYSDLPPESLKKIPTSVSCQAFARMWTV